MIFLAPTLSERSAPYWTGGADGQLLIARCGGCGFWAHPPQPVCPSCRGREVAPQPVSGRGTVYSWTVNRYRWVPELEPPYVIAEVELVEQAGLTVLTTVRAADVTIGMPVGVAFERVGDESYVPYFVP